MVLDNEKEEKAFVPDQNKEQDDQGFDTRNQYSGSGSFSPDEQEELSNEKGNLEKITGQDLNSIKPDEVPENNTDTDQSEVDPEKEEE
jgi:hypothetical protein